MAWVMSVKPSTALPTPGRLLFVRFLQRDICRRGSQADTVSLRNQLQGRPLCPQPLLRRTHPPINGGALWRKNPKSSKSCSMTR